MSKHFFLRLLSLTFVVTILFSSLVGNLAISAEDEIPTVEAAAQTEEAKEELKLGVRLITPFVNKDEANNYTGFSIDLWKKIAERAKLPETKYTEYGNVGDLINATEKKEVDAGIAAVSITADRESRIDFSQPMFDSGLQILVSGDNTPQPPGPKDFFNKIFKALWNQAFLSLVIAILLLGFILANIAYFLERIHPEGIFSRNYLVGIMQAFWWSLTALASQSDHSPMTKQGRVLTIIWMYFSVIFLTFFQAQITSDLTAQRLQGEINGIEDLGGKKVVSIAASTASKYLTEKGIPHATVQNLNEAYVSVTNRSVDALVYDSAPLAYYANNEGKSKVQLVGEVFKPENYGITMPQGSPLANKINLALLSLKEDGSYKQLYDKYFGSENKQ
jgi:polar amino acid transport system substrate-binding protein